MEAQKNSQSINKPKLPKLVQKETATQQLEAVDPSKIPQGSKNILGKRVHAVMDSSQRHYKD